MPANLIQCGAPAHKSEADAQRYIADGLPSSFDVYSNVLLVQAGGRLSEIDAVVVAPHCVFVVEIKSYTGTVSGWDDDWDRPTQCQNPVKGTRIKAQSLASELERKHGAANRPWVEPLVFLSHASRIELQGDLNRAYVRDRGSILGELTDPGRFTSRGGRLAPVPAVWRSRVRELLETTKKRRPPRCLGEYELGEIQERTDDFSEYRAHHRLLACDRVLRVYEVDPACPGDDERVHRGVRRESEMLKRLEFEPRVLRAGDPFRHERAGVCVPFEYFPSVSLRSWVERNASADAAQRFELWRGIAQAIAATHRAGLVHRQLRPEVVRVGLDSPIDVRVGGFELAREPDSGVTVPVSDRPTRDERLRFAAPETRVNFSCATPASDVYSLGALLVLILTGSESPGEASRHAPNRCPRRLLDAALRMMEEDPAARPQDGAEALKAAEWAFGAESTSTPERRETLQLDNFGPDLRYLETLAERDRVRVYRVRHEPTDETRVLKVAYGASAQTALRAEFETLRHLHSRHVPAAFDLTQCVEGALSLLMEDRGRQLSTLLSSEPDLDDVQIWAGHLFDALACLEEDGVVHKDLKPENLVVDDCQLAIIDFSLACAEVGDVGVGTAEYRDPALTGWSHAADRYSAVLCLFEMLTGRHAFRGASPANVVSVRVDCLPSTALATFFVRALARNPADRPPTLAALRHEWEVALGRWIWTEGVDEFVRRRHAIPDPVTSLGFRGRTLEILEAQGVATVGDLLRCNEKELLSAAGLRGHAGRRRRRAVRSRIEAARAEHLPICPALACCSDGLEELELPAEVERALVEWDYVDIGIVAQSSPAFLRSVPNVEADMANVVRGRVRQLMSASGLLAANYLGWVALANYWDRVGLPDPDSSTIENVYLWSQAPPTGFAERLRVAAERFRASREVKEVVEVWSRWLNGPPVSPPLQGVHSIYGMLGGILSQSGAWRLPPKPQLGGEAQGALSFDEATSAAATFRRSKWASFTRPDHGDVEWIPPTHRRKCEGFIRLVAAAYPERFYVIESGSRGPTLVAVGIDPTQAVATVEERRTKWMREPKR